MAQVINTNVSSLNAQRNLNTSQSALATSLQRLSSGLRINSAKDDAAGLAISSRMTTQINGNTQAARNANDGISLAQTAEGALGEIGENLQRMRVLAVQSANATNSASDRAALQKEVAQLAAEIDRVAVQTSFNGAKLLDGSFTLQKFQVGANVGETIDVEKISSARTSTLGAYRGFSTSNLAVVGGDNVAQTFTVTFTDNSTKAYSFTPSAGDAKEVARSFNAQAISGLTATANATVVAGQVSAATTSLTGNGTATLTINGLVINLSGVADDLAGNRTRAVEAINAQSAVTGVKAEDTGGTTGVKLTALDGRNITTTYDAGTFNDGADSTVTDFGLAADETTISTVKVDYVAPDNVRQIVGTGGDFAVAFDTQTVAQVGTAVSLLDISTVDGANTALKSIDAALTSVNTSRADLGAIQNRFASTVTNLQTMSENLSASRSRILDADFAAETAALTRNQILQQAGVAMLSQANALPQNVLSLLK